ncbi:hypothetical protein E9M_08076 [Moraxella catarrhalis 46P47B1]|nr:hypothetical protein E9G_08801 [Moraxella catarrhalis 7169]EGE10421.1 hypothetical protein E9M_08076 [Moraxella catarrhalis 46P47B1]EGE12825.1 hypothetical protein E9K_07493 [Moraxella catarrhalis 103P14B1]EGE17082.1 hypothetical protein E9O_01645 [Moraxella catarrhalis 12P80B1]EGE18748.1 hypothetical protein E9S_07975 [Moraxella catarrhalis BC7]EGE18924.1 hypothetical protein E9U_08838 [Moraxella catarrhalis BC8]EGE24215.1 hypothetical protein E9Y_07169 [Moraxella catarrhalis 101P30B1]EG
MQQIFVDFAYICKLLWYFKHLLFSAVKCVWLIA